MSFLASSTAITKGITDVVEGITYSVIPIAWAVITPSQDTGTYWCVDSTGASKSTSTVTLTAASTSC
jgi:hypothetical protein